MKQTEPRPKRGSTRATIPVDEFLKRHPPAVREILRALREAVRRVAPLAEESAYRGWPIVYRQAGAVVCTIQGFADRANLGLGRGTDLKDPEHLLEGTGRAIRHVKVRSVEEARRPAIRRLLEQAFKLSAR